MKSKIDPFKKALRLLLCLGMAIITSISCKKDTPLVVAPLFEKGDGTPDHPFIISTAKQLDAIRNNTSYHYKLEKDIDLNVFLWSSGSGWIPIISFTGSLDGAGHKITSFWTRRVTPNGVGLIAENRGSIKNLGIEMAEAGIVGTNFVGGVAGVTRSSSGSITNCYVTGNVSGTLYVGGVTGGVDNGSVTDCYTSGAVSGDEYVGGVAGIVYNDGRLANCYATGTVGGNRYVGGVAGGVGYNGGTIINCVALNPCLNSKGEVGRVTGGFSSGTLANNWARIMTIEVNGAPKSLNKGNDRVDGADITPFGSENMQEWWQASMWTFGNNNDNPWKWGGTLPMFYWQTIPITTINKVTEVVINPGDVTVEMGKVITLTATVVPVNATYKNLVWNSLSPDIATVNVVTGVLTGISEGKTTIRATSTDGSGTAATIDVVVTHAEIKFGDGDWYAAQTKTVGPGIDLVFLGDGYTAEDIALGKYEGDMQAAIEMFFDIQPYKEYRNYFNAYIVGAVSAESQIGTDGVAKNTKFSTFHDEGPRVVTNSNLCFTYAQKAPIGALDNSVVILVANSMQYGGTCFFWNSGRAIAICPTYAPAFEYIVQHEAGGHGFGMLADEYINEQTAKTRSREDIPWFQSLGRCTNVDITNDPSKVIWKDFIGHPKYPMVGVFEGGYYFSTGVWRSEDDNRMRGTTIAYFNAPSRAAIVKRIKQLAGEPFSIEWFLETDIIEFPPTTKTSTELLSLPPLPPPIWVID
ncbi:MAG: M64 family metallo-endopeptidase [Bacteroidales bacterium]|nr:M64 family metallo-endopeptidase [Bacteroidales bacterium]